MAFPAVAFTLPTLIVHATRRRTLTDCVFPVAAARACNSLPSSVIDAVTGGSGTIRILLLFPGLRRLAYLVRGYGPWGGAST